MLQTAKHFRTCNFAAWWLECPRCLILCVLTADTHVYANTIKSSGVFKTDKLCIISAREGACSKYCRLSPIR
jgi:hypothetical protein